MRARSKLSRRTFVRGVAAVVRRRACRRARVPGGLLIQRSTRRRRRRSSVRGAVRRRAVAAARPRRGVISDFGVHATRPTPAQEVSSSSWSRSDNTGTGWKAMDHQERTTRSIPARAATSPSRSCASTTSTRWCPGTGEQVGGVGGRPVVDVHRRQGQMWSNGDEVTAEDYVDSFQYTADPKHAWDFTFFWDGDHQELRPGHPRRGARRARSASSSARTSTRSSSRPRRRRRTCPR